MNEKVQAKKTSEIVFRYSTPGLGLGVMVSGSGILLYIVYMFIWKEPRRKRSVYMAYLEDDENADHSDDLIDPSSEDEYVIEESEPEEASEPEFTEVLYEEKDSDKKQKEVPEETDNKSAEKEPVTEQDKKTEVQETEIKQNTKPDNEKTEAKQGNKPEKTKETGSKPKRSKIK